MLMLMMRVLTSIKGLTTKMMRTTKRATTAQSFEF